MIHIEPVTLAIIAAAVIGLIAGIVITVLVLVDRPRHWVMWIRVPEDTYKQISASASAHSWSIKDEILHRLRGRKP